VKRKLSSGHALAYLTNFRKAKRTIVVPIGSVTVTAPLLGLASPGVLQ
jgi:hypothetical protein